MSTGTIVSGFLNHMLCRRCSTHCGEQKRLTSTSILVPTYIKEVQHGNICGVNYKPNHFQRFLQLQTGGGEQPHRTSHVFQVPKCKENLCCENLHVLNQTTSSSHSNIQAWRI